MVYLRRITGVIIALTLIITLIPVAAIPSHAQTAKTVTADGSSIVASIVKADADAYTAKNPDVKVNVNVSGSDGGFDKLCKGQIDIALASRAINNTEVANCQAKGIKFIETVLGYD